MKSLAFRSVVLLSVMALLAAPTPTTAGVRPGGGLQERLDEVVADGAVGAWALVRDRRERWRGTSGVAALDTERPVPVRSHVRVGSITKTFVAVVVLQLVDEGVLRLHDPVERWLPAVVPGGDRITVRNLLDHTSGLHDYRLTLSLPPSPEFVEYRWRTWTARELVSRALSRPPTFEPPGSAFAYSNTNYTLLGQLIEAATGRDYGREIRDRIIRPLRLRHTTLPGTSPWMPRPRPHGYVPVRAGAGIELVDFTDMNPSLFGAGGEAISTVSDLDRFYAALLRGRLLPGPLLQEMTTPGTQGGHYGLGLAWRDTSCGVRVYGNDGDALSYQAWSYATEDVDEAVTLALTPNFRGDTDDAVETFLNEAFCR